MKSKLLLALLLFSAFLIAFSVVPVGAQGGIVLGICIDGSSSISSSNFAIMKQGIADAIRNNLPHDGTVELVVVQFSTAALGQPYAYVEYGPTVIDSDATAEAAAITVENIVQINGATPTADGLYLTWQTMKTASLFATAAKRVINLATDGVPNQPLLALTAPPSTSPPYDDAVWVVSQAAAEGLDELDAEAIAVTISGFQWLRDELVYPPPGFEVPTVNPNPYDYDGDDLYDPGWVRRVEDFQEFADTIGEKLEIIVEEVEVNDVEAVSQTVAENEVLPGTLVDIVVTVHNPGDFTESFDVTCYYDSVEIGTKRVENLAPGASATVTFTWDTTSVPLNGYAISAHADSGMEILEVDEDNNWCHMPLPIFVIPELPFGAILALVACIAALAVFKTRKARL